MKIGLKIFSLIMISFLLFGCSKIKVKKNLDFEINSKITYADIIEEDETITIIDEESIDTSKLGKVKVVIKYLYKDELNYKTVDINIIDTTPPKIKCDDKISITKGTKLDINKYVTIKDNSKETIKPIVSGSYDINKVGDYKLLITAFDSTGNKSDKEITLTVKNYAMKTSGYYVYKAKTYWVGISFRKNNKVRIDYNLCPGSGCGGISYSGTYKIKDNKLTFNITSVMDESGSSRKNDTWNCTIKSNKKIVCYKDTYTWKEKFN